jgi:hypothetical protein
MRKASHERVHHRSVHERQVMADTTSRLPDDDLVTAAGGKGSSADAKRGSGRRRRRGARRHKNGPRRRSKNSRYHFPLLITETNLERESLSHVYHSVTAELVDVGHSRCRPHAAHAAG